MTRTQQGTQESEESKTGLGQDGAKNRPAHPSILVLVSSGKASEKKWREWYPKQPCEIRYCIEAHTIEEAPWEDSRAHLQTSENTGIYCLVRQNKQPTNHLRPPDFCKRDAKILAFLRAKILARSRLTELCSRNVLLGGRVDWERDSATPNPLMNCHTTTTQETTDSNALVRQLLPYSKQWMNRSRRMPADS